MQEPSGSEGAARFSSQLDVTNRSNFSHADNQQWENITYNLTDAAPYRVYVELRGKNGNINKFSVGAMLRKIDGIRGHIIDMKYVGRFKVMVIINNFLKANLLVEKVNSQNVTYKAYVPSHLVSMTGVIAGVPVDLSEDDIKSGLDSEFPILRVSRLHRFANNERIPLARVSVTFRSNQLPDRVKLFDCPAKVLTFVRKVDLCEKCLRFGHRTTNCRGARRCNKCSEQHDDEEDYESCDNPVKCANCKSAKHTATEGVCPERKRQQNINELRAKRNLTYIEARDQVPMFSQNPFELLSNIQEFPNLSETVEANADNLRKQWQKSNIPRESIKPAVKLWKPKQANEKNKKKGIKRPKSNGDSEAEDSTKESGSQTGAASRNGVGLNNPHKTTDEDVAKMMKEVSEKTTEQVNLRFQEQVIRFYSMFMDQGLPADVEEKFKDISKQCFDLSRTII